MKFYCIEISLEHVPRRNGPNSILQHVQLNNKLFENSIVNNEYLSVFYQAHSESLLSQIYCL